DAVLIDLVLTRSENKSRPPLQAADIGFDRLHAARSLVIVDTGRPPPRGFDETAHAGALSFEMSHERERIIVNCGAYRGPKSSWSRVARASAGRRKVNRSPLGCLRRTISPASVGAGLPRPRWQSCHAATAEWHVVAAASRRRRNEPRRERLSWLGRGPEDSASGFERNG